MKIMRRSMPRRDKEAATQHFIMTSFVYLPAVLLMTALCFSPRETTAELQQVAPDLYFNYDHGGSNSVVMITDDGVLVVDTRMHPDDAALLLADIRKLTEAPIRYVINSQFHGDHYMGNIVFQGEGAVFIAHTDTLTEIEKRFDFEVANRPFAPRGQDPSAVVKVLPEVTFEHRLRIYLGGRVAEVLYLGAGQNKGDTLIYFPHAKALHTGGVFHNRSWANTSYTPSFEGWIDVLTSIKGIGADTYLPPHGEIATSADLEAFTRFINELIVGVKAAVDSGLTIDEIVKDLTFEQYSKWRGYERRERNLTAIYEFLTTGEAEFHVPDARAEPLPDKP